MTELEGSKCSPCEGGAAAVTAEEEKRLAAMVPDWTTREADGIRRLEKVFLFEDFRHAMKFAWKVGKLADRENHHPVIKVEWGRATVAWWTHKLHGLHRNDFVMAAKTDAVYVGHSYYPWDMWSGMIPFL